MEEVDPEEEKFINEAFDEVYKKDPKLRALLAENASTLSVMDKRQLLIEIREKGGVEGLMEEEQE